MPAATLPSPSSSQTDVLRRHYEIRAEGGSDRTVRGYASVWGSRNSYCEVFVPGAFTETIAARDADNPLPMLWLHREPIGAWNEVAQDVHGLSLGGRVSDTQTGNEALTLVGDRALNGLSIGFRPMEEYWAEPGETVTFENELGKFTYSNERTTFYITRAQLVETSLVVAPSDDEARLVRSAVEQLGGALPALRDESTSWEDVAFSMALLMGGRGAGAFRDVEEHQRRAVYTRLASQYERHDKTPPAFTAEPEFSQVSFAHDEREVFADRYLRKNLSAIEASTRGIEGPLTGDTLEAAQRAVDVLRPLIADEPDPESDEHLRSIHSALTETTKRLRSSNAS